MERTWLAAMTSSVVFTCWLSAKVKSISRAPPNSQTFQKLPQASHMNVQKKSSVLKALESAGELWTSLEKD